MNKKSPDPNVDFADSELETFNFYDENTLVISIKAWDSKKIILKFKDAIYFTYNLGFQISDFFEVSEESELINKALARNYEKIPVNHPYKLYEIEDINDFPFIQVVAESVAIFKRPENIDLFSEVQNIKEGFHENNEIEFTETYNPRHHGVHYHVERRNDTGISWNKKSNVRKLKPDGASSEDGTGFLPGEYIPEAIN